MLQLSVIVFIVEFTAGSIHLIHGCKRTISDNVEISVVRSCSPSSVYGCPDSSKGAQY